MPEIVTNTYELERAREELARGFGAIDAKRPAAWKTYGYREQLTFADYHQAYERGGAAHGAVHRLVEKCWQKLPRIKQPNADKATPWETEVGAILGAINAWAKLQDLDRRNLVGRYAALIYRVADNKRPSEPMDRAQKLVDIIPVFEDEVRVTAWHSDTQDPDTYGKPAMWQYRQRPIGDTQGKPEEWADVHPSRVQVLAEGSSGANFFDGIPLLKAGFNSLVNLEKIEGGSAESYLKNSARTLVFKYDANSSPQSITEVADGVSTTKTVRQVHEEQTRALNANTDASIVMQGGDASTLQTQVNDPDKSWMVAANSFAASVRMPFTVIFGQQTGRLASDEDKADMLARAMSRQTNLLTPMLVEFIQRMQAAGIIKDGAFEVEWPPLDAPGDKDKADILEKLTAAMERVFRAGSGRPLFDNNELRKVMGFEAQKEIDLPDPAQDDPPAGA
jgi:hypothetical protein